MALTLSQKRNGDIIQKVVAHIGKYEEGIWWYEDEVNEWIRCDGEPNEARDPGVVYDTVIAWQPIPEPYKGGQNET